MATSLEYSQNDPPASIKPFHLSVNTEILEKIGPVDSEKQVLDRRPLKNIKLEMRGKV